MRTEPTADERKFYAENGFLRVPDFLDEADLRRWRDVVDAALSARRGRRFPFASDEEANVRPSKWVVEDRDYYDRIFTQRINLWQTDGAVKSLLFEEPLGRFVGELAGVAGLRIWSDQAFVKEPYGNPTAFHIDVPYWSFTSSDAITIWVALDDATLENGCLYYVPGSHKAGKFDNVSVGKHIGALFEVYPEWKDVS